MYYCFNCQEFSFFEKGCTYIVIRVKEYGIEFISDWTICDKCTIELDNNFYNPPGNNGVALDDLFAFYKATFRTRGTLLYMADSREKIKKYLELQFLE